MTMSNKKKSNGDGAVTNFTLVLRLVDQAKYAMITSCCQSWWECSICRRSIERIGRYWLFKRTNYSIIPKPKFMSFKTTIEIKPHPISILIYLCNLNRILLVSHKRDSVCKGTSKVHSLSVTFIYAISKFRSKNETNIFSDAFLHKNTQFTSYRNVMTATSSS